MQIAAHEVVPFEKGDTTRYVEIHELTLAQLRQWLVHAAENPTTDWMSAALLEQGSVADLAHFTDLNPDGAEAYTPSELAHLWDRVKAINAHFFAMLGRLEAGRNQPSSNSKASKTASLI
ncbi:hypothetical protein CEW87_03920 [Parazoarcus communis]|uniref:Uncharacterized protein n=1 Tax=Parazoarcus communis TaxID=41977 RepID=A0A2U8GZ32_9RHOO|nr:hypothetical protein [Parazoarcus communis]AWI78580.1 hypothetical protein CEW87_03920 [Parazoarcus communis]